MMDFITAIALLFLGPCETEAQTNCVSAISTAEGEGHNFIDFDLFGTSYFITASN